MKLPRLGNDPSRAVEFFQEGLETLGAVCERTWHDRLQLVAEGPAARLWNSDGTLLETEIHFVAPDDTAPRNAESEVFPGCPLTFRLAEALRPKPLPLDRGILRPSETPRAPTFEVAERLWHTQMPGCARWKIERQLVASHHFSLLVLARCEIQAIDQHWTLHRLAISLPDGELDDTLATQLDFLELTSSGAGNITWPVLDLGQWQERLRRAFQQELATDLVAIRERQQRYLQRELERIESYFEAYERELGERHRRSHSDGAKIKAEERLAAAKTEHARRRQDQIHRHEIRVMGHLDALVLLAEPAWEGKVSFVHKGESKLVSALFNPRSRRWALPETLRA